MARGAQAGGKNKAISNLPASKKPRYLLSSTIPAVGRKLRRRGLLPVTRSGAS